jgi:hypothetical protein
MFIVPLLPFLYFSFAVVEWITGVVEAVIGIPLWALTFITAEGDLGSETIDGAKILFEILLRPTITVLSLLVAIIVFTASVSYFNEAMDLYIGNSNASSVATWMMSGFAMILIYMITVYILATSCFKVIDAIPNNFGRWLGMDRGYGQMQDFAEKLAFSAAWIADTGVSTATGIARTGRNMVDQAGQGLMDLNKGAAIGGANIAVGMNPDLNDDGDGAPPTTPRGRGPIINTMIIGGLAAKAGELQRERNELTQELNQEKSRKKEERKDSERSNRRTTNSSDNQSPQNPSARTRARKPDDNVAPSSSPTGAKSGSSNTGDSGKEHPKIKEAINAAGLSSNATENDIIRSIMRLRNSDPAKAKQALAALGLSESAGRAEIQSAIAKLRNS